MDWMGLGMMLSGAMEYVTCPYQVVVLLNSELFGFIGEKPGIFDSQKIFFTHLKDRPMNKYNNNILKSTMYVLNQKKYF